MRKQPEVTERTRAALTEAFWSLYAGADGHPPLPVDRISVRAITERAGYNRATFYLYFRDVHDLLGRIEDRLIEETREVVQGRLMREKSLDFSVHMSHIAELARHSSPYFCVLIGEHGDPAFVARFREELLPFVAHFLVEGRGLDGARSRVLCDFYLAGVVAAISTWLSCSPELDVSELIELLVSAIAPSAAPGDVLGGACGGAHGGALDGGPGRGPGDACDDVPGDARGVRE